MVEQTTNLRAQVRDRVLLGTLYVAFFSIVFVIGLYATFPYERLRDFVASKLSSPEGSATGQRVEIGELSPTGLGGVHIRDLTLTQTAAATPDTPPTVVHLSEATARLALLPLLFGRQNLTLEAQAGAGTLDGQVERTSDEQHVQLDFNDLDAAELGVGTWVTLPVKGKARGKVDLRVPADLSKSTGSIDLEISGLRISDGKAKLKPPGMPGTGFTLDEIDAGKLKLGIDVKDGVAKLTRCSADGKDLKLAGKGKVTLADPWKRSRPDLDLDLTFSDAYKNKSDRTKAMFELIGMQPDWQRATTPDGTMKIHIGGTFLAIRGGPGR
ncbi:MAG: type II secretion system protein GspN [Polyangiales bacterium]